MEGECVHVEILEGYPVVRVRPLEDGLENDKVIPGHEPALVGVCDTEKRSELVPPNLAQVALRSNRVYELLVVQEPGESG